MHKSVKNGQTDGEEGKILPTSKQGRKAETKNQTLGLKPQGKVLKNRFHTQLQNVSQKLLNNTGENR